MGAKRKTDEATNYDRSAKATQDTAALARTGKILIKWEEAIFEESAQGRLKYFSSPQMEGTILPEWKIFVNEVKELGGKHNHQGGGLSIFVLEGEGYSIVDGVRIDWEAEDLILLPIKPGGVTHQHFNKHPERFCRWIAFRFEPFHVFLADRVDQIEPRPGWELPSWSKGQGEGSTLFGKPLIFDAGRGTASKKDRETESLYWDLIRMRDQQREEIKGYMNLVKGKEVEWEWNPQGKTKWYLHPSLKDRIQTFLFYIEEVPPGSRSGRQRHQGGKVMFVLEGRGHSQVGDRTVNWGNYDYIAFPRLREGIVIQHFNDDPGKPARFIVAEPNLYPILGVDMGAGFEQLENAPEFKE